jgi:hypothetical protein
MAKKAKHYRVGIDGSFYPYSDATQDVTIKRELVDLWSGQPGKADACMNHHCIIRNAKAFPHPVIAASVVKSRVYIFDTPNHVIRYVLSDADQRLIGKHDTLKIGDTGLLRLQVPGAKDQGRTARGKGKDAPSSPVQKPGHLRKSLGRGEKARIAAAVGVT